MVWFEVLFVPVLFWNCLPPVSYLNFVACLSWLSKCFHLCLVSDRPRVLMSLYYLLSVHPLYIVKRYSLFSWFSSYGGHLLDVWSSDFCLCTLDLFALCLDCLHELYLFCLGVCILGLIPCVHAYSHYRCAPWLLMAVLYCMSVLLQYMVLLVTVGTVIY